MSARKDPLYRIFEQHLFNAMVEDETSDDFVGRVVHEYMKTLTASGLVPHAHRETLAIDLHEEVMEMLRKKTYGHFSLTEFRKKKMAAGAAIQSNQNLTGSSSLAGTSSGSNTGSASSNNVNNLTRTKRLFSSSSRSRRSS